MRTPATTLARSSSVVRKLQSTVGFESGIGVRRPTLPREVGFVIVGRLFRTHERADLVAISTRPDAPTDHHRRIRRFAFGQHLVHQANGVAIRLLEFHWRITELRGPVGVGAPRRALEDKPRPKPHRQLGISAVIIAQHVASARVLQQDERGEAREFDFFVKDERRFEAAIGDERDRGLVRQ